MMPAARKRGRRQRTAALGQWRRIAGAAGLAGLFVLVLGPAAFAASDVFSNIGPASQVAGGSLVNAYPLGHYSLDHHFAAVEAGVFDGIDVSGIPPTIAWWLANQLWQLTAFLANTVITLFTFAFSLDLVRGSSATGGAGALAPVSDAVRSIYRTTFGEPWLVLAIVLAGMWAMWHGLVRRRYTETAGALGLSLVFVLIALAFVTQPERTIGQASRWTNEMSGAFLSLTSDGSIGNPERAKRNAADQLFALLVYEPWAVLQFGGLEHCVRAGDDDDPESVPVRPLSRNPARDAELSRRLARGTGVQADGKTCASNRNKYAPRFLRWAPGSDERNDHYEALREGDADKAPEADRDGYRLTAADKPAADAMGEDGQYQRLLLAVVIFTGELGVFLLLGGLSVAVILAQVVVLLLLAFAPVALVVGVFPGRGHDFFKGWLSRLVGFLFRKAIYSLILAVLLTVAGAVGDATSSLGWLMGFGLQGGFFWMVFLLRRQLVGQLVTATTGQAASTEASGLLRFASLYTAAHMGRRLLSRRGGSERPARSSASQADPASTPPGPQALPAVAPSSSSESPAPRAADSPSADRATTAGAEARASDSSDASLPPRDDVSDPPPVTPREGAAETAADRPRSESATNDPAAPPPLPPRVDETRERSAGAQPTDPPPRADGRHGEAHTEPPLQAGTDDQSPLRRELHDDDRRLRASDREPAPERSDRAADPLPPVSRRELPERDDDTRRGRP